MSTTEHAAPAEKDVPHCSTCACASVGYVQKRAWGEWESVCTVTRCGWRFSQGNQTQEDAERRMRSHAAIVHPPRIPVRVLPPGQGSAS